MIKDPDATLDYSLDWSRWLTSPETIANSTWACTHASDGDTAGITIVDDTGFSGTATTVWISGGVSGVTYRLTNTITTSSSPIARIDERSLTIEVRER